MFRFVLCLMCVWPAVLGVIGVSCLADEGPRFNEIQVIGTHNSYHLAPEPAMMALIERGGTGRAASINYSHRPLWEQFAVLGVRQIELDVFADPEGGHYRDPKGRAQVAAEQLGELEPHDPDGRLLVPGLKVLHVTDFDYRTTVYTFVDALREIKKWSDQNPGHVPLTVLVEVKEGAQRPGMTSPVAFDAKELENVDREIRSVFSDEEIILPDDIRAGAPTLREAVLNRGWPLLESVRGKVLFALDNGGAVRDQYLEGNENLAGRVLFVSVEATHPAAAFMKLNDPIGAFDEIQKAVRAGFIVRTRADSPTRHARENDTKQRERALASGAQFVSTDYPEPDLRLSAYQVALPEDRVARGNPLVGDPAFRDSELDPDGAWVRLDGASGAKAWHNPFAWGMVEQVDDEIHLQSDRNFMLATRAEYRDFVFEVEAIAPEGNSGIFFRCQLGEKKLLGYQAEIESSDRQYSGGVYDNTGRGFLFPAKGKAEDVALLRQRQGDAIRGGDWNRYRIECFGNRIRVAINGRWITDIRDEKHREGVIGLQHHGGKVVYRFRNIRVRSL